MANKPNNPELWSRAKSMAKQKFDVYPCVPMDSQALTKDGWKYYHQLNVGDNILAYNKETGKNEWTPILALQFFNDAPLIRLFKKQTNFDIKCTPNHKWVLAEPNSKYPDNLVEAKDITKHMSIKISAELSDNGEGLDLTKFFKKDSWVKNILNMNIPQIQSYFASGIVYDGNDKGLTKKEDKQTYGFSQKEKDHGLAMEIAAVLLGYRVCSVNKKHNPSMTSWTFIRRNGEHTNNLYKEDAGVSDVWCPTTKFGTWVMKQNGYVTITGNSAYANGWAAKWYKSKGGTWRKAQDGMDIMREGGINNPGFKALPKQVQQNIIQNMSKGGSFNDAELLRKHKAGESIGFTAIAHLKAKGLIPRSSGEKRVSDKYKKDGGRLPNYKSGMKGTGAQPELPKRRNSIKPSSLMKFGGNTKIEHGSAYYQDGGPFVNTKPFIPIIDDTELNAQDGSINMEAIRQEAKKLNSKIIKTKTGAFLYFDDEYNLMDADDGAKLNQMLTKPQPKKEERLYKAQDGVDSRMIQARPFVNQKPIHVEDVRDYLVGYDNGKIDFDFDMLRDRARELGVDKIRITDEEGSIFGFDPKNDYKIIYKNTSGNPERIPGEYKLQQGGRLIRTEDPDGEMALGQIRSMHDNLYQLEELINANSELEPWVNSKLTLANDYLDVVADYMKYNPENEDGGEYMMTEDEYEEYQSGGGIPTRYKNMGFTKVGQKKQGDGIHKWKVLAKKGDKYKVVQGGWRGMEDFKQHGSEQRKKNFWSRMGGRDSARAKDPFSPLYWHKRFGTWQDGGNLFNYNLPKAQNSLDLNTEDTYDPNEPYKGSYRTMKNRPLTKSLEEADPYELIGNDPGETWKFNYLMYEPGEDRNRAIYGYHKLFNKALDAFNKLQDKYVEYGATTPELQKEAYKKYPDVFNPMIEEYQKYDVDCEHCGKLSGVDRFPKRTYTHPKTGISITTADIDNPYNPRKGVKITDNRNKQLSNVYNLTPAELKKYHELTQAGYGTIDGKLELDPRKVLDAYDKKQLGTLQYKEGAKSGLIKNKLGGYANKKFKTLQDGGNVFNPNLPVDPVSASIFSNITKMQEETPMMKKGGYSSCMQCGGSMKFKKGGLCGCGKRMKYGKGGLNKNGMSENFKIIHESDVVCSHPGDSENLGTKDNSRDKPVGFMYTKTINKTIKR